MKLSSKKIDLFFAFILNIAFLIVFTCFFEPVYEYNDDLTISFLVEGAFGSQSEYLIYQNVLWGKFLVLLYQLVPTIKWYNVLLYAFTFLSFVGVTYALVRVMGRKIGTFASSVLVLFCGYQSYIIFQYSRIATIATAAGMVLLFFAIEYAESKLEKRLCIVGGAVLAIWGSMLRFQMFALAVAITAGGVGVYRVWKLFSEKKEGWVKRIGTYVAVFGTVGVLSVGLYAIDRLHYSTDEGWSAFMEFNEARTELWDYGFPDYAENYAAYEAAGFSPNDFWFYLCWNMDVEHVTTENLQIIADAKEARTFSVKEFIKLYPAAFIGINIFVLYLVAAIIAVGLDKKNLFFALYGFFAVLAVEAYFFYTGRYGIPRVDVSMWMAAILGLCYGVSDSLGDLQEMHPKWLLGVMAASLLIYTVDFNNMKTYSEAFEPTASKEFYEEITSDEDHLYVVLAGLPAIYYTQEFWEPCEKGEFAHVYNAWDWDWGVKAKFEQLEPYGIVNIYEDAINNPYVYFVAGAMQDSFLTYIQENYNPNVVLECQGYISENVPVFTIRLQE